MKIGDIDVCVDLVSKFELTEKAVVILLEHVTFNINDDFNYVYRSLVKNDRDLLVITKRSNGSTLEEVGAKIGVTRESVRQIEAKIVKKLILWLIKYSFIEKVFAINGNVQLISREEMLDEITEENQLFSYILQKYLEELGNYEYIETINSNVILS